MFYWRQILGPSTAGGPVIELGFTSRAEAIEETDASESSEAGPFGRFNLGGHVGDDPVAVERNRHSLAKALGVPRDQLLFMRQVHGTTVLEVSGPWSTYPDGHATGPTSGATSGHASGHAEGVNLSDDLGDSIDPEPPACDGIVTRSRDLALAVLVADCVPVLLHDSRAAVVAAVHAGRPGMTDGIVPEAVHRMRELGARDISAVVGPSVCGRCYEVPEELVMAAARTSPVSATRSWTGTPAVDVASGVVDQLTSEGVAVQWVPGCTREDAELYSYRRERRTGRFAGVIVMRSDRGAA